MPVCVALPNYTVHGGFCISGCPGLESPTQPVSIASLYSIIPFRVCHIMQALGVYCMVWVWAGSARPGYTANLCGPLGVCIISFCVCQSIQSMGGLYNFSSRLPNSSPPGWVVPNQG